LVLDEIEWDQPDRMCYYLAEIAAQVQRFMEGFTKAPKEVKTETFIKAWVRDGEASQAPPVRGNGQPKPEPELEPEIEEEEWEEEDSKSLDVNPNQIGKLIEAFQSGAAANNPDLAARVTAGKAMMANLFKVKNLDELNKPKEKDDGGGN
jgi:hypothetical protein